MSRVRFKPSVIENITDYYPYKVLEGERPDIVSFKKYGTVVLLFDLLINDIADPLYQTLPSRQFEITSLNSMEVLHVYNQQVLLSNCSCRSCKNRCQ